MVKDSTLQRKRQFWSDEEDSRLVGLVEVHGIHSWPEVAAGLPGRDSKSCSLRWRYFLAPHIIRTTDQKMTDWEVAVLFWAQRQYGNKWRTIVDEYLPWRSPNDLKNYCNQYILGKGSHVVAQNKLLLQGMSLQVLLSHQPPEVIERWKKVKQMQQSAPQNEQRPVKKGTRGLSYIIRQAAKLQSQRFQPYPQPSGGPSAAAAADGEASPPGTSATSRKKRHSSPLSETGAGGFTGGAQPQGCFLNSRPPQHQYFAPQPAVSAAAGGAPYLQSGGADTAAAAASQHCPMGLQQQQVAGAATAGFSAACVLNPAVQQYGGPTSQSPSGGASLLPFAPPAAHPPAGSFSSNCSSSSSRAFSHSPGQYSSGIPVFHHQRQQQQQGTMGGSFMGQGSCSFCLPPAGAVAGASAAAAAVAGGVGGMPTAMQGALPPSWTPPELSIATYGQSSSGDDGGQQLYASGLPLGPPSNSSCITPSSGMNMNMATPSSTAMDMNMGACFPVQGVSGPGCSYLTAAGGAAGGAFGYQGPPQGLQQSAGSFSGWSNLEGPCFTSGNSISSNSSSTFALDPGCLHSPTNQSCSQPYLPAVAQQQQAAAAAYNATMQSGLQQQQQQQLLINPGYQLLPPLQQQQQQQQQANPVGTYQPGSAHSTPPKHQQQQRQWPSQEPPARYSGTGATSEDDDLSLLLGMEAADDDDIDPADIAELLGSDSGEELESIYNANATVAAAAAAAVVVGEAKQQGAACFSSCPDSKAALAAAVAAATAALQLRESLIAAAPAAAAAAGKEELQYRSTTTAGDLPCLASIDAPSAAAADGASGADIDSDVDLELLLELTAEDSLSDIEPLGLEEHLDGFEAVMLAAGW